MARYDDAGKTGGCGGGSLGCCADSGGNWNPWVPFPLWKKKDEKSRGFELIEDEVLLRVKMSVECGRG